MFMNLCPYFWLTIASLFVLPFVWLYNVIKNGFITFFDKISEHMDKIFDKELENWVKTLNEAQIIELENIGGKLIAYPIIFCLITFFHYCFALMHTSFETFMFFYNKDRFVLNVANMEKRLNKK